MRQRADRTGLCSCLWLCAGLFAAAWAAAQKPEGEPPPDKMILGFWRGTSTCVDLARTPDCKDEEVLYEFTPLPESDGRRVHMKASTVVGEKIIPAFQLDFTYDPDSRVWSSEFENPHAHGLWSFTVAGVRLIGSLLELPSRAILRTVSCLKP